MTDIIATFTAREHVYMRIKIQWPKVNDLPLLINIKERYYT